MATPSPYLALYRRYRPQRFADLAGQEHVARALSRAVAKGQVAHAYLFSGPRGTGKTSAARILAMATNCQAPQDGEPCGACEACRSVRSGSSLDVAELDAASQRRLEDMRELLSHVPLASPGRRKVYIVDEVHQLTADAASALLKTLEEPPAHVTFVLATTEPEAVPETIRSRCQHFNFGLLSQAALTALVRSVADAAGLDLPPEDLAAAVAEGAGSARDALSALERIAMGGGGRPVVPTAALAQALAQRDVGALLAGVAEATAAGFAPRQIAQGLLAYLRQALLSLLAPSLAEADDGSSQALAKQMGLPYLVRAMEGLGRSGALRSAADPRVSLEATLLACAAPPAAGSAEALAERIGQLEAAFGSLRAGARPDLAEVTAEPARTGNTAQLPEPEPARPEPEPEPAPPELAQAGEEAQLPEPALPQPALAEMATEPVRNMAQVLKYLRAKHGIGVSAGTTQGAPQAALNGSQARAGAGQVAQAPSPPPTPQDGTGCPGEPSVPLPRDAGRPAGTQEAVRDLPALCAEALDALGSLADPLERLWSALEALARPTEVARATEVAPSGPANGPAPLAPLPERAPLAASTPVTVPSGRPANGSSPPVPLPEGTHNGRAMPAAPGAAGRPAERPANGSDDVQMILDVFPGSVVLSSDASSFSTSYTCAGCGKPVIPAPGSVERGWATLCLPCFERRRAESRR